MKTVRLTTAQAIVRYLIAQRTVIDGVERAAVPRRVRHLRPRQRHLPRAGACRRPATTCRRGAARTSRAWRWPRSASPRRCAGARSWWPRRRSGPARTNMVTAAGVAHANRLPVLLLSGDTFASRLPDPVLQQVEHFDDPSITVNDAFKAGHPLLGPHHAARADRALAAARCGDDARPGRLRAGLPRPAPGRPGRGVRLPRPRSSTTTVHTDRPAAARPRPARSAAVAASAAARAAADHRRRRRALLAAPRPSWRRSPSAHNIPVVETVAGKATPAAAHPLQRRPDRRHRLPVGQRAGRRGRRRGRRRHPAAGLHHRLVDGVRRRRCRSIGLNAAGFDAVKHRALPVVGDAREALARARRGARPTGAAATTGPLRAKRATARLPRLHRQDRRPGRRRRERRPTYAQVDRRRRPRQRPDRLRRSPPPAASPAS